MDQDLKNKIIKLAQDVGVRLDWETDPGTYVQWDGKKISCLNQNPSNIIHDIAHFAVAPQYRRKIIDFGLGQGPDSFETHSRIISAKSANEEEERASALGIWWEKKFGMNWKSTATYHAWDNNRICSATLEQTWESLTKSKTELMTLG